MKDSGKKGIKQAIALEDLTLTISVLDSLSESANDVLTSLRKEKADEDGISEALRILTSLEDTRKIIVDAIRVCRLQ